MNCKKIVKYFKNTNHIKEVYNLDENNLKHDKYYTFYPKRLGGTLKNSRIYNHGKLQGEYIEFYQGEIPYIKCFYNNGELENTYLEYYPNGKIAFEKNYNNGKLNGKYAEYVPTGKKRILTNFKNGEVHGEYIIFDNFGISIKEVKLFDNGVLINQPTEKNDKSKHYVIL